MFRALGDRAIVNDDIFAWDDLPGSVAVFGPEDRFIALVEPKRGESRILAGFAGPF